MTNAYNQGVTEADNRVNTNSTNYKEGYNAGLTEGSNSATSSFKEKYKSQTIRFGYSNYAARLDVSIPVKGYSTLTINTGSGAQYIYINGTRYGGSATVNISGKEMVSVSVSGKDFVEIETITYTLN